MKKGAKWVQYGKKVLKKLTKVGKHGKMKQLGVAKNFKKLQPRAKSSSLWLQVEINWAKETKMGLKLDNQGKMADMVLKLKEKETKISNK